MRSLIIDVCKYHWTPVIPIGDKGNDEYTFTLPDGYTIDEVFFYGPENKGWFDITMGDSYLTAAPNKGDTGELSVKVHWWYNGWGISTYKLKVYAEGPDTLPLIRGDWDCKVARDGSDTGKQPSSDVTDEQKLKDKLDREWPKGTTKTISVSLSGGPPPTAVLIDTFITYVGETAAIQRFPDAIVEDLWIQVPPFWTNGFGKTADFILEHIDTNNIERMQQLTDETYSSGFNGMKLGGIWQGKLNNVVVSPENMQLTAEVTLMIIARR